jgi:hypothetical protein
MERYDIRILNIEDKKYRNKLLPRIYYYDQNSSPHICMLEHFVTPEVKHQLYIGQKFKDFNEFENFLNQK